MQNVDLEYKKAKATNMDLRLELSRLQSAASKGPASPQDVAKLEAENSQLQQKIELLRSQGNRPPKPR